jgi:hypothetical protein
LTSEEGDARKKKKEGKANRRDVIVAPKWALRNFGRILHEFHGNFIQNACISEKFL